MELGVDRARASTFRQFTAVIDNSVTNPPPTLGTVLSASLNATVATKAVTASAGVTIGAHLMNLAMVGTPNRVPPGGLLTYTMTYGNASTASSSTTMTATVPTGTTFVSATGGGILTGSTVQWDLGTLAAGFSDLRQFTIKLADSAVAGSLLFAQGQLLNSANQQSLVRESASNLVSESSLLSLAMVGSPDPAAPGGTIVYKLAISNNSTNTATGAFAVDVNVPKYVTITNTGGGGCSGSSCRLGSDLFWNLGSIAAGASTCFSLPQWSTTRSRVRRRRTAPSFLRMPPLLPSVVFALAARS